MSGYANRLIYHHNIRILEKDLHAKRSGLNSRFLRFRERYVKEITGLQPF